MKYLKFTRKQNVYKNPRTGQILQSIEGMKNRRGIDEFDVVHDPNKYPNFIKEKKDKIKKEKAVPVRDNIFKMDITDAEFNTIIAGEDTIFDIRELTTKEIEEFDPTTGVTN